jgi:hypothetical protein
VLVGLVGWLVGAEKHEKFPSAFYPPGRQDHFSRRTYFFRRRARKLLSLTTERLFMPASPPVVCQCGYFWKQWEEVPYWRSRGNATPAFFSLSLETEAVGKVGGDAVSLRGLLASMEARFLQELGGKPE